MTQIIPQKVCRLCGVDSRDKGVFYMNIFESDECIAKIEAVVPDVVILRHDLLSKSVCHRCIAKVKEFFDFKQTCILTQNTLKRMLPWNLASPIDDHNAAAAKPSSAMVTFMGGPLAYPYGDPETEVEVLVLSDDEELGGSGTPQQTSVSSHLLKPQQSSQGRKLDAKHIQTPFYSKKKVPSSSASATSSKRVSIPRLEAMGTPNSFVPLTQSARVQPTATPQPGTSTRLPNVHGPGQVEVASNIPFVPLAQCHQYQQDLQRSDKARVYFPPSKRPCITHQVLENGPNHRSNNDRVPQTGLRMKPVSNAPSGNVPASPHIPSIPLNVSVNMDKVTQQTPTIPSRRSLPSSLTFGGALSTSAAKATSGPGPCPPTIPLKGPVIKDTKLKNNITLHHSPAEATGNAESMPHAGGRVPVSASEIGKEKVSNGNDPSKPCDSKPVESISLKVPGNRKASHEKPKPKSKKKRLSIFFTEEDVKRICDTYPFVKSVKINKETTIFPCDRCNKILTTEDAIKLHDCVSEIQTQPKQVIDDGRRRSPSQTEPVYDEDSNSSVEIIMS